MPDIHQRFSSENTTQTADNVLIRFSFIIKKNLWAVPAIKYPKHNVWTPRNIQVIEIIQ